MERAKRGSSHPDRYLVVDGLTAIGGPGHPPTMSTVLELESAILELPADEFWKLADWFDAAKDEAWSKQMQADAEAGRLDFLFAEVAATQAVGGWQEMAGPSVNSTATPRFWQRLHEMPEEVQALASKN